MDLAAKLNALPLHSRTAPAWGRAVLAEPVALLTDHAFLEKKAAYNAMDLMSRWPEDWASGWVETWVHTMTGVARDEAAHLSQVTRLLMRRGGRLARTHRNPYASSLRDLVRSGQTGDLIDRVFVSALIELRSCERFAVLASTAEDPELAAFYNALCSSELGHYKVFLRLANKLAPRPEAEARWQHMLASEAHIIAAQLPGPRIHSGQPV